MGILSGLVGFARSEFQSLANVIIDVTFTGGVIFSATAGFGKPFFGKKPDIRVILRSQCQLQNVHASRLWPLISRGFHPWNC